MINFVLKYTGAYGLLAVLAVAIVTPTYLFFSNQQEKVLENKQEKVLENKQEKVLENKQEKVLENKQEKVLENKQEKVLDDPPKKEVTTSEEEVFENKQEKRLEASAKEEVITEVEEVLQKRALKEKTEENTDKQKDELGDKQEDKIILEEIESLSVDVFRVDELGNIISAGKVSKKAKIEILTDNKLIIGAGKTAEDGSFVVFGKAQTTGLVQSVKIRGIIEDKGQKKIVSSADLFFVLPQVERNNEKEKNKIGKTPLIVQDDGKDLKVLAPIKVSSVDSITLDTISYNENSSTELAGRARLANSVRIYLNNKLESEVNVNESGAWKASLSDVQTGVYTLRLDEVNENGTVQGRLELPFKREEDELIQAMGEGSITVQPGNSLWRIARKYYGKGIQYVEIFDRNSHLIKDPDLIYPGQIFSLPN